MPTYEYQCEDCSYRVEYFQSIKEPPRTVCPQCSGTLKRLVTSGAGLIFKGSGFYITDYKHKHTSNGSSTVHKKADSTEKSSTKVEDKE